MDYVGVITAQATSERLPNKNLLPFAGKPLVEWTIIRAVEAQLPCLVVTDDPDIDYLARTYAFPVISHPPKNVRTHKQVVEMAIQEQGWQDSHIVLLQPTSPFRSTKTIVDCIQQHKKDPSKTVATVRDTHNWPSEGGGDGRLIQNIVGDVLVYTSGNLFDHDNVSPYPISHLEAFEIDTVEDYIEASSLGIKIRDIECPVDPSPVVDYIKRSNITECALVVRDRGMMPPLNMPAFYVNHCYGYKGGRVDGVFLSGGIHLLSNINDELRECVSKANVVFVMHPVFMDRLREIFPEDAHKIVGLNALRADAHSCTTGCLALCAMGKSGARVWKVGFTSAEDRVKQWITHPLGHRAGLYFDAPCLYNTGELYEDYTLS